MKRSPSSCVFLSVSFPKKRQIVRINLLSISLSLSRSRFPNAIQFHMLKDLTITITMTPRKVEEVDIADPSFSEDGFWIFNNFKSSINA